MSIPRDHHFLPQFYLRRWTSKEEGGRLIAYRRLQTKIEVKRFFPAAIGYEPDLYTVPSRADPAQKQEVETEFMSPLDARAAAALTFLEKEKRRPEDPSLVSNWSRFIMSLLHRSPERMKQLKRKLAENDDATMQQIRQIYEKGRGADDPPTFEEYRALSGASIVEEGMALLIRKVIDNPRVGHYLNNMQWAILEVPAGNLGLLTSDNPVVMSNGLASPDGFIMVPTGPSIFFIASNRKDVAQTFAAQTPDRFVRAMNDAVVRQASKLVIGNSDFHTRFVSNRLGIKNRNLPSTLLGRLTWRAPLENR